MRADYCLVLCAICLPVLAQAAEKHEKLDSARKSVVIESAPVMLRETQKPADKVPANKPALDHIQSYAAPVPQNSKVPAKQIKRIKNPPPPELEVRPEQNTSPPDHAADLPSSGQQAPKQAPKLVSIPKDSLSGQQDAIRDANQARIFEEARDAVEALRQQENVSKLGDDQTNPDLGLGGASSKGPGGRDVDYSKLPGHDVEGFDMPVGTEYLPDLPDNQDKAPPSIVGAPSGDLRGAMQGADSDLGDDIRRAWNVVFGGGTSTGGVVRLPNDVHTTVERTDDGGVIVRTWDDAQTHSETTAVRRMSPDGPNPNGWVGVFTQRNGDGSGSQTIVVRNEDGDVLDKKVIKWDPGEGVTETQDPNADAGGNGKSYYDHSKDAGPPVITQVDPGPDGAMPQLQAPQLVIDNEQLVINPSPENAGGQARELSREQRSALAQQLLEKVKGPGGHPGKPPSDPQVGASIENSQTQ